MCPRRRPLADDDVQLIVLERGIELLFEHGLQAVNFIQKKHLLSRRLVGIAVRSP